jgi:DNA polymerase-3 subunit gamma/tau
MEYLRNLLMVKVSRNPETLLNAQTCNLEVLKKQAQGFHADELQQMFTILSRAETEMKRSSLAQMVFEMAILRLTETRPFKKIDDLIHKINQSEAQQAQPLAPSTQSDSGASPAKTQSMAQPENGSFDSSIWAKVRQEVSRKRPAFEHYLDKCQVLALNEKEIQLMFSDPFTLEMVETPENVQFIKDMVRSASGHEVQVVLKLGEARPTPSPSSNEQKKKTRNDDSQSRQKTESEIIQDALEIFGGIVVK